MLELLAVGWPEFMQHDPTAERYQAAASPPSWPDFQVLLLDRDKDELAAVGVSIPFAWDETPARAARRLGRRRRAGHRRPGRGAARPTALSALSVTVAPERRGQGLSRLVLRGPQGRRRPGRAGHAAGPGAAVRQERLPAHPHGALHALGPARRRPLRPLAAHPLAARGASCSAVLPGLHGDQPPRWPPGRPGRGCAFPETGRYVVPDAPRRRWPSTASATSAAIVEPNVWLRHTRWAGNGADLLNTAVRVQPGRASWPAAWPRRSSYYLLPDSERRRRGRLRHVRATASALAVIAADPGQPAGRPLALVPDRRRPAGHRQRRRESCWAAPPRHWPTSASWPATCCSPSPCCGWSGPAAAAATSRRCWTRWSSRPGWAWCPGSSGSIPGHGTTIEVRLPTELPGLETVYRKPRPRRLRQEHRVRYDCLNQGLDDI